MIKFLSSKKSAVILLALSFVLLIGAGYNGARAALTYFSEDYSSEVEMYDIGVTLLENGENVAHRDYSKKGDGIWSTGRVGLLKNLVPEGETFRDGKKYDEVISAKNSGTINEYVRIVLKTYWEKDGEKRRDLKPEWIEVSYADNDAWVEDKDARTEERRVFYYTSLLEADEETEALTEGIKVNEFLASKVTQETTDNGDGTKTITTTYDYDGVRFILDAEVDAVQEHNAHDAALSAWGRDLDIDEEAGTLSLGN